MSGQNIAEKSKKIDTLYLYDKCFYVISITYMQARRR